MVRHVQRSRRLAWDHRRNQRMSATFDKTFDALRDWCEAHDIRVRMQRFQVGKAGEFDGLSIVMNPAFESEELVYYLAHGIGSIVRRSLTPDAIQRLFNELRDAKKQKETEPTRLEEAIARYRDFETESSEFAVWLLAECGHSDVIGSYTNFMRADLEAMTEFHRTGRAPVWRDFFRRWNEGVAEGRRKIAPFCPKAIPPFRPVRAEKQEILQRQDEEPTD
jgi:hypothetical protein